MNIKKLSTSIIIIQFLILSFILMFVTAPIASACSVSTSPVLKYFNLNGSTIRITSSDNLVLDSMASSVRASLTVALSDCTSDKQQNMWMDYWDDYNESWQGHQETGWAQATNSTSQYTDFNINLSSPANIAYWSVGYQSASCDTICYLSSNRWIQFWYMHQNYNQVTSAGFLSASYAMPWYTDILTDTYYPPIYSVLVGTDLNVKYNRDSNNLPAGSIETQIPQSFIWEDGNAQHPADAADHGWRRTFMIQNYLIPNLQPNTTYYWRIKQVGSSTTGYFPGDSFTTAPAPSPSPSPSPTPTPTPSPSPTPSPTPVASVTPSPTPSSSPSPTPVPTSTTNTTTPKVELPAGSTICDLRATNTVNTIFHVNGGLTISAVTTCPISFLDKFLNLFKVFAAADITRVIFVDGVLNINDNFCNTNTVGSANCNSSTPIDALTGTVYVVSGNVIIDPSVTRIDAVIISYGTIYTEGVDCTMSSDPPGSQLIINGSLVSLNADEPIQFCRKLADNSTAAEKIVNQPKYLVILRDLMSTTVQKWSEIP